MSLIHNGCGGDVEWVDDPNGIDEDYVCQKCGQYVDGEDMTSTTSAAQSE